MSMAPASGLWPAKINLAKNRIMLDVRETAKISPSVHAGHWFSDDTVIDGEIGADGQQSFNVLQNDSGGSQKNASRNKRLESSWSEKSVPFFYSRHVRLDSAAA
jgi:hypothetical protein